MRPCWSAVSAALVDLGPRVRAQVIAQASTNLHNLAHGHLATLFGSAFVTDAGPMYFWLPCLVCLLALAELIWRSGRLAIVFVTGHIGATLLVAVGLTAAIEFGWLPLSISRASDVGVSYGAVAVLGALTAAIPSRWRPAWIGWWVPVGIAAAALGDDFTDVGHSVALVLGMLVSLRLGGPGPLDAGPVCVAGGFRGLRVPGAGARRLVDVGRGESSAPWALWRPSGSLARAWRADGWRWRRWRRSRCSTAEGLAKARSASTARHPTTAPAIRRSSSAARPVKSSVTTQAWWYRVVQSLSRAKNFSSPSRRRSACRVNAPRLYTRSSNMSRGPGSASSRSCGASRSCSW